MGLDSLSKASLCVGSRVKEKEIIVISSSGVHSYSLSLSRRAEQLNLFRNVPVQSVSRYVLKHPFFFKQLICSCVSSVFGIVIRLPQDDS